MIVNKIKLSKDGLPKNVTIELSIEEAAYFTKVIGSMNDIQANEVMNDGAAILHELYEGFTGDIFNRYWDGGIHEFLGNP